MYFNYIVVGISAFIAIPLSLNLLMMYPQTIPVFALNLMFSMLTHVSPDVKFGIELMIGGIVVMTSCGANISTKWASVEKLVMK